jgi:hypothetical protein
VRRVGEIGGALHYGYIAIDTTSSNGFPATIRRIVYESTANTAIIVPNFCGVNATIISVLDIDGNCTVDPFRRPVADARHDGAERYSSHQQLNRRLVGANTRLSQPAIRGKLFTVGR